MKVIAPIHSLIVCCRVCWRVSQNCNIILDIKDANFADQRQLAAFFLPRNVLYDLELGRSAASDDYLAASVQFCPSNFD